MVVDDQGANETVQVFVSARTAGSDPTALLTFLPVLELRILETMAFVM